MTKTLRLILLAIASLSIWPAGAAAETQTQVRKNLGRILGRTIQGDENAYVLKHLGLTKLYDTNVLLHAATPDEGSIGYALDSDSIYVYAGTTWRPLDPRTPEVDVSFNEGASKGIQLVRATGAAYDSTAGNLNYIYYKDTVLGVMTIVDAGNTVPTADATGLDITAGNVTDNDHVELFSGTLGTSGRPFVVGTDAAFEMCVTYTPHDVSGSDFFYCGFRTTAPVTVSMASYSDYCAIGYVSGNYGVNDKTTGATDAGTSTIVDDAQDTICTKVSGAGACTYTIDGAAPNATDPHTLGDGLLVEAFCQLRHDADGADDQIFQRYRVGYQQ